MPSIYRYTKEHPYIGKGLNRKVKAGKEYTKYEADIAEFNELFMDRIYNEFSVNKMSLAVDEVVSATINYSRKNYSDYFPEKPYPKDVKLVGNTVKSKKLVDFIANFLSIGIRQLLQGDGQGFLDTYYDYIDKIYNYRIPLRQIASKGKIKKSLEQYLIDIKEITKAGRPKSRQAWYELALKEGLSVGNGETIYYINTGTSKSHSDVKKITHYFDYVDGEKVEITKEIEKKYKEFNKTQKNVPSHMKISKGDWIAKTYPTSYFEEEILLNCMLVPRWIIDADDEKYCSDIGIDGFEYNCPKYIQMFNNRIKPLLVCFSKEIRSEILITDPKDRKYFTKEQCELVSGEPNNPGDQDTYEALMTMEDKEIKFWTKYDMVPPFLEECGMGKWEDIVNDYNDRIKKEKELGIDKEKEMLTSVIQNLTKPEIDSFLEEGEVPASILKVSILDPETFKLMSKNYPDISIGSLYDIMERGEEIEKDYDFDEDNV